MPTRALVAYAGRSVRRRYTPLPFADPRFKFAIGAARTAYMHRKRIRYAGRKIMGGYRRYKKRRAVMRIGDRVGSSTAKSCSINRIGFNNEDTRKLYQFQLWNIVKGQAIDNRERDIVNLRGYRFNCEFVNRFNTAPLQGHICVLVPKALTPTISTTDFFRAHKDSRAEDFNVGRTSIEFMKWPVNTDKYHILMHHRFTLAPSNASEPYNTMGPKNWYSYSRYLPIKRQIRYDGSSNADNTMNISLCYWFDYFGQTAGATSAVNAVGIGHDVTAYFREPKT
ncbi:MAG: capsid protein [Tethyvirus abatis]|uniref:Capsid protein n=1 Tax=Cressdnaviricota sp. TaxID=2748378 RepID=A0A345N2N7_9VIRU|nr:MAG: capsid protein [Cressdnaviricota sp.]